jgi:predicted GIY-YIG superfamily endonuclease
METLYVLQLEDGKYYVGKSNNVPNRYKQHKDGNGSAWTKKYRPIKILEVRTLKDEFDETNTTKLYMKKYGVNNVRGGAYCQVELPEGLEEMIQHELRDTSDKCFKCGKVGHIARYCKGRSSFKATCECGNEYLDFEEYMTHMRGCKVRNAKEETVYQCEFCPREFKTEKLCLAHEDVCQGQLGCCYRCGRTSHYSPDCYAKTHINGKFL